MTRESKKSNFKRSLIEWTVIILIGAILYLTGLHTPVLGTLQRAMLWTGFFDADTTKIANINGPQLSQAGYNFRLKDQKDITIPLSRFKGDVIFLNIWASWCPPCIAEMPTIQTLKKNIGNQQNIKFVLLSMDENSQKAVKFMTNKEYDLPYYFPASRIPGEFQSQYLPTTYIISKKGQIVYKKEGIADYSSLNFARWMIELAEK